MSTVNMKKRDIIELIRSHYTYDEAAFRRGVYKIAREFDSMGDTQLAEYIMALAADTNVFVPQGRDLQTDFVEELQPSSSPFFLPTGIKKDMLGLANALTYQSGINRVLLYGAPGTGKTESVRHLARITNRQLFSVKIPFLIDSRLGQTAKNITYLFSAIKELKHPERAIILFDEIDALALDRNNSNDLREMGRVTSTLLKELDSLSEDVVLIATTNLFNFFDRAFLRRFDATINFDRYSKEDIVDIAENFLRLHFSKNKLLGKNIKLFRKIIAHMPHELTPGELKNVIKTAISFSEPSNPFSYLQGLYSALYDPKDVDLKHLRSLGFTLRDIEILTGISKSQVGRELSIARYE